MKEKMSACVFVEIFIDLEQFKKFSQWWKRVFCLFFTSLKCDFSSIYCVFFFFKFNPSVKETLFVFFFFFRKTQSLQEAPIPSSPPKKGMSLSLKYGHKVILVLHNW